MPDAAPSAPVFEWLGGHLALDLVNTLGGSRAGAQRESLQTLGDLLTWCQEAGLWSRAAIGAWRAEAERGPARAARALERARALREVVQRVFANVARRKAPLPADLELLSAQVAAAGARRRLATGAQGVRWSWAIDRSDLALPVAPVALAAVELLLSPDVVRVRECSSETCDWLFLDTSRNGMRRWCDMKVCGNRHKVRAHRARRSES